MPLRKKRDERAMEQQHETAAAERNKPEQQFSEEFLQTVGRSAYTFYDREMISLLTREELEYLLPLFSHLNRMTQLSKEDIIIARLDIEAIFMRIRFCMKEKDYTIERSHLLSSLEYFAWHIPVENFEGFKAKLVAYVVKILRTELQEKKTKGLFG